MESHKLILIRLFLFILGLTAMATQVIIIREFMAVFQGNELIIGLFLGFWMLLTAIGAFVASKFSSHLAVLNQKSPNRPIAKSSNRPIVQSLLLLLSFLPLFTLFALAFIRASFIPTGVMVGIGGISLILLLVLTPFCLVSGFIFPLLVQELSAIKEKNLLHEGYALDSAGGIVGAVLFSLAFIFILKPFESLLILTFICLLAALAGRHWGMGARGLGGMGAWRYGGMTLLVTGMVAMAIIFILNPDRLYDKLLFKNQDVLEVKTTPFGKLVVTKVSGQLNIYENGVPLATGDDPVLREESVHYAMLLHQDPENVLLISGGTGGTIEEILKYPVRRVDYLEFNPWMIKLIGKYRPFSVDERVSYIYKDPGIFLDKTDLKYDVILLNTPGPSSAELNRFYTREFYMKLKDRLNEGGIVSLSVPAAGNYMNETSRMMHSVYYNTLQTVFSHIRIIPGFKDYYLASDAGLEGSFFGDFQTMGITNVYVNPQYISEDLQKMRTDLIMKDLLPEAPVNSDLKPYVFSLFLKQWLARFKMNTWIITLILVLSLILSLIFLGPLNLGLFAGGFTASALEFLLLIWFQVIFGFVYQMTGIIFAIFMAGLAIGSFYRLAFFKNSTFRGFLIIQAVLVVFSALSAVLMLIIPSGSTHWMVILIILVLVFTTGLLMGIQFSLSGHLRKGSIIKSSGESFSADLLGAAIGVMMVSVYIVPQFGLPATGMVLAGLNVAVMGVMAMRRKTFKL